MELLLSQSNSPWKPETGLFLATLFTGPTYAAGSSFIQGTIREDPRFLWGCTAVWLVSDLFDSPRRITQPNFILVLHQFAQLRT